MLRNIYRSLVGDGSTSNCAAEAAIDERVATALLEQDDPDIVIDLRRLNGNPQSTKFDLFWEELELFFEEQSLAVDDRRHDDVLHMPLAVSVRHLREAVMKRLEEKFPGRGCCYFHLRSGFAYSSALVIRLPALHCTILADLM